MVEIVPDPPVQLRKVPDPEPTSTYVKWAEPPAPVLTRLEKVTRELQRRPGEWGLIAVKSSPLIAWWRPLIADDEYELTLRLSNPDDAGLILAPRDVYARYVRRDLGGAPAE